MKQIVFDQLRPGDSEKLYHLLSERFGESPVPGIFWAPLPGEALAPAQQEHPGCAPFSVALELSDSTLSCELLIRSQQRMRCSCVAYATKEQLLYLLGLLDGMLDELGISI